MIVKRGLTRFEIARIIGARALQLALGAPAMTEIPSNIHDPVDIAIYELEKGVIPITVKRLKRVYTSNTSPDLGVTTS